MTRNKTTITRKLLRHASAAHERDKKLKQRERLRKIRLLAALLCTVAAFTASLCLEITPATPMHTSSLTGQVWLNELIAGHPTRFREQLGLAKHAFFRLSFELQAFSGLVSTKYVSADEKLATFLHFARMGCSSRMLQERFQRSAETIHK